MFSWLTRILDHNEREIRKMSPLVRRVNEQEPGLKRLSDGDLRGKTDEFRDRLKRGETEDDILPEAFAVVREAAVRAIGQRHFDVQLMGGIVLHQGKIAEMKTGEGKTLVAALPIYLNAISGKGAHVITVNDYLAERDSRGKGDFKGMANIYEFLGLTVGVLLNTMKDTAERKKAYEADVTYGKNSEFGFDYLRDNMATAGEYIVQRKLNYCIVDEVDSILIDEARTPHIISGPAEESTELYFNIDRIIPRLAAEKDYKIDEKHKNVTLTEEGVSSVEKLLRLENLYDERNIDVLHHVVQALRAHTLFKKETDYIVKEGKVVIVDEFTGRLMPGRRWSDGLHQAIEAKERVKIEEENQTMATVTLQNYFRMYAKLAGMTGTAKTEATEFAEIYRLDVLTVPTHRPMVRIDRADQVFRTEREKFNAIIEDLSDCYERGQPVLVGTTSIDKNERLSGMLKRRGVPHEVLNAKQEEREATIIANAGQAKSVTIATNMAGRGTDIQLGPGVADLGGLYVLGTERNESRRIDNQLRGRSGRQGDPGLSCYYLSLEDDLLRLFAVESLQSWMGKLGMQEGEVIEHPWVTKAIERAQKAVEGRNFEIRKHLLEYDDVMNKQREIIYAQRRSILEGEDISGLVAGMIDELVDGAVELYLPKTGEPAEGALPNMCDWLKSTFALVVKPEEIGRLRPDGVADTVKTRLHEIYRERENAFGGEQVRELERMVMLNVIDSEWKNHLYNMDRLKEGIGLAAYGQKDPLIEYKKEGFAMFSAMLESIKQKTLEVLFHVKAIAPHEETRRPFAYEGWEERPALPPPVMAGGPLPPTTPEGFPPGMPGLPPGMPPGMGMSMEQLQAVGSEGVRGTPIKREAPKVGRNEPCPCGSGKKYKKCHGAGK
jgi:preprotein translocase subunit SecA